MRELIAKRRVHQRIIWFDVGAGLFFITIGLLLLGRGLWHLLLHHELLLKTFISSVLFSTVGVLFALQGVKSKRQRRGRSHGKVSKRHRSIKLWLLMLSLVTPLVSSGQVTNQPPMVSIPPDQSTACNAMPSAGNTTVLLKFSCNAEIEADVIKIDLLSALVTIHPNT